MFMNKLAKFCFFILGQNREQQISFSPQTYQRVLLQSFSCLFKISFILSFILPYSYMASSMDISLLPTSFADQSTLGMMNLLVRVSYYSQRQRGEKISQVLFWPSRILRAAGRCFRMLMWTRVGGSQMRDYSLSDSLNYYLSFIFVYFNNIYYFGKRLQGSCNGVREEKQVMEEVCWFQAEEINQQSKKWILTSQ